MQNAHEHSSAHRRRRLNSSSTAAAQEVYGKLKEPDGLAGLAKLRSGGAALADQVMAAEKAGSWSEALGLHEQVPVIAGSSLLREG